MAETSELAENQNKKAYFPLFDLCVLCDFVVPARAKATLDAFHRILTLVRAKSRIRFRFRVRIVVQPAQARNL
jgi:hypothetical protein